MKQLNRLRHSFDRFACIVVHRSFTGLEVRKSGRLSWLFERRSRGDRATDRPVPSAGTLALPRLRPDLPNSPTDQGVALELFLF
jgi:hypothetical protein